jgi:hypothetical protein
MRKQTRYTLLAVGAVVVALAVAVYLRWKAPPDVARLLPESDAIVYANLKPLRAATHFDRGSVTRSATYQQFVDATGIVAERDLDAAAFALHRMSDPNGPNGEVAYSEVFQGRFDAGRLSRYLAASAKSTEDYAGRTIYAIPSEGRTLRVAVLGYDMVAASNMPTTEQIHSILDRERAGASPFAGSSLLSARYGDVPAFSVAWAVGHVGLPFSEGGQISVLGLKLPLPEDTTFVASVRYLASVKEKGALHLAIEEIAESEAEAAQSAEALRRLLGLLKAIERAQQPEPRTAEDRVVRELVDSLRIEQRKDRATLTAVVPAEALRELSGQ